MASTLVMMVLALGGSAVGQLNAVILLTPAEITWATRQDGGKISVIEFVELENRQNTSP